MTQKELHVDFSFKINKTLFLITGIEVEKKKYDPKHKFIFFFNIFWLFFDGAGSVFKIVEQIMSGNEFEHIAYTSPIMVLCSLSMFKSISVLYYRDIAHGLYSLLQNLEIEEQRQETTLEKENVIKEERSFLHRVINLINFVFIALSVAFAMHPLCTSIYTYYKRNEVILLLPFQIKYPFDAYSIKYWPAIYLHQLWSEVVVIWNLVIVDHLFFTFCTYIRVQFRLLQHDLEHLINDEELSRDNFATKFRELIQRHIKLIQASDMLEAIYTKSFLCNFLSSSVMICLTGFDLVMISNKTLIIIFISFLAASLLQVFFLCFFADLLMVSSMEIGDALYNSKWYLKDSTVGKSFLIVLIRSQRPCKLTAYTFVDLNLRAFMRVVSNAWSYFALLQTIYG